MTRGYEKRILELYSLCQLPQRGELALAVAFSWVASPLLHVGAQHV